MPSPAGPVHVEVDHGVMVITLDRPEARNAVDMAMAEGIAAAVQRLDDDDDLRVGIITGAGGTFCAGMDLKGFVADGVPSVAGRGFAGLVEAPPETPLIAAVSGHAVAGGLEIVLACDLIVADRTAVVGIPEVRRGLIAGGGGLLRLPGRIGVHHAADLALTGRFVDAEEADRMGLWNRLVAPGAALDAAMEVAGQISANGPLAVRASKAVLNAAPGWAANERWDRQMAIAGPVATSRDAREGATAFAEKRPPVWEGR